MTQRTETKVRSGEYYARTWGYDQTNIDYVVVVRVSPSGKTAMCRRARPLTIDPDTTAVGTTPAEPYGPEFPLRIRDHNLVGSYPFIVWANGADEDEMKKPAKSRSGWSIGHFSPLRFGDLLYETRPEFGH